MRKVKFKSWVPPLYIAEDGSEHEKYGQASIVNRARNQANILVITKEGTNQWSDYIQDGLFHTWSISGSAEDGLEGTAIIELPDGTIKIVAAENIKFID